MKKLNVLFLALLAAMMVIGFAGCKKEADTANSDPAAVAVYEQSYTEDGMTATGTISCYKDNTWTWTVAVQEGSERVTYNHAKGSYNGDITKNGTVKLTATHEGLEDGKEWIPLSEEDQISFDIIVGEDGEKIDLGKLEGVFIRK